MAVDGSDYGQGGHPVKRGVDYGGHSNGHATDKHRRHQEEKHVGQNRDPSKEVTEYCSNSHCIQYHTVGSKKTITQSPEKTRSRVPGSRGRKLKVRKVVRKNPSLGRVSK